MLTCVHGSMLRCSVMSAGSVCACLCCTVVNTPKLCFVAVVAAGPAGALVECKGLAINQQNPHLLGVACGDPYVRLFDRRRLSTCEWCCASCQRRGAGGWRLAAVWV